jgi:DUF1365 family protein
VSHGRRAPVVNRFQYGLFMLLLRLDEIDTAFRGRWFWSAHRPAIARFRREDHLGDPAMPLDHAVRDLVERETGRRPEGKILLLTQLRHFGFAMNPVCVYYCHDAAGARVEAVVLEVHNTPWGEMHAYVLADPVHVAANGSLEYHFDKTFHVSPFMEMDYRYRCVVTPPAETLVFHLENRRGEEIVFDATLTLWRRPLSAKALSWCLLRHPFMTGRVAALIYWQALRLWWKGTPFFPHPKYVSNQDKDA